MPAAPDHVESNPSARATPHVGALDNPEPMPGSALRSDALRVSVIGCGWLGLPLAEDLISSGFAVAGTTTTPAKRDVLRSRGIAPVLYALGDALRQLDADDYASLFSSQVYVVNIPPSGAGAAVGVGADQHPYLSGLRDLLAAIPDHARLIIFCSTTSVYDDAPRICLENDVDPLRPEYPAPPTDPARHGTPRSVLLAAEALFAADSRTVILRLAGLYAEDRHPVRYLSGRHNVAQPEAPINLIHRIDCIDLVQRLIQANSTESPAATSSEMNEKQTALNDTQSGINDNQSEMNDNQSGSEEGAAWDTIPRVVNVCADEHPSRRDYYTTAAQTFSLPAPQFDLTDLRGGKTIDNTRMRTLLGRPVPLR